MPAQETTSPCAPTARVSTALLALDRWEDFPAFRETLLLRYPNVQHNTALRALGAMLAEIGLECSGNPIFPPLPGPYIAHELRAVASDLRHAQGFLEYVRNWLDDLDPVDEPQEWRLAKLAGRLMPRVAKIADAIEAAVADVKLE